MSGTRTGVATRTASAAGVALVALGAGLWGVDGVWRQPLAERWSTWTIVLYEHVILVAVVLPALIARRGALRALTPRAWAAVVAIAWGASAVATLAFTRAFATGNPTVVVLLQKTQPLFAITAAAVLLRERPRPRFWAFVLPALLGTYLLSFGSTSPADAFHGAAFRSALYALLAAALWGSATALGRRVLSEVDSQVLTGLRFTLALPFLFGLAAYESALGPPQAAVGRDAFRLVAIALVPGLVAMLLYYRGLRTTPASVATLAELAFPATALVVNRIFLHATVDRWQLLGFAIVWLTIAGLHHAPVRLRSPLRAAPSTGAP